MLYLNHAGTSFPKPKEVHEAAAATLRATPDRWAEIYQEARSVVEEEFDPGRLRITSGCTAAIALALGELAWEEGDILVTSSMEHHALDRVAQALEANRGIVRRALPYRPGQMLDLSRLEELLKRGDVRAVALTAASNITGERAPLESVSALCRACGTLLLIDAAQTFGTELFSEARRFGDIIVAAGHKHALGPQGVGLLFAREEVQFASPGAVCEVGETECSTFPGYCDAGSVNLAGLSGLAAGLKWSRDHGRDAIAKRTELMAQALRRELGEDSNWKLLGAASPQGAHPLVSFVPASGSLGTLQEEFSQQGMVLRVGTHCAPQALGALGAPDGCVRVSFGAANTPGDEQYFLGALREVSS